MMLSPLAPRLDLALPIPAAATPADAGDWPELLREAAAASGVTRPVDLHASAAIATPITWGARRPRVVLPAEVEILAWDEPRMELVGKLAASDLDGSRAELRRMVGGLRLRAWYTCSRHSWSSSHRDLEGHDWDLEHEATERLDRWDEREGTPRRYVRARGTLGNGGGRVRVRTVNGDIELRRGD